MRSKELIGEVTHYFSRIGVAVVELQGDIRVGDRIRIEGATTSFEQQVESMEIENERIEAAGEGQAIGLKVKEKVRPHDRVYRVEVEVKVE